jgi:hypothetical protein
MKLADTHDHLLLKFNHYGRRRPDRLYPANRKTIILRRLFQGNGDNFPMSPENPQPGARTDRWDLAAGGTVYAPEHPLHLAVPGFWDAVEMGGREYRQLLGVSFVLGQPVGTQLAASAEEQAHKTDAASCVPTVLTELFPYLSYWHWYPDRIEARYYLVERHGIGFKQQAGVRVFLEEKRWIDGEGSLHCALNFDLLKQHPAQLQVVAWGVEAQLTVPDGPAPNSVGRTAVNGPVVPKLAYTPLLAMLRGGALHDKSGPGEHTLHAVHWVVTLAEAAPVTLHVAARPA